MTRVPGIWAGNGLSETGRDATTPAMKIPSLAVLALAFLFTSCERHTWEDNDANGDGVIQESEKGTKRLYEAHGDDGGEHGEAKEH